MKKIFFNLFAVSLLFFSCSKDDTNDNETPDNPLLGRWKLIEIKGETLGECEASSYVSFTKDGIFEERRSGSDGFSIVNIDGTSNSAITCTPMTSTQNYEYNISASEISLISSEDITQTVEITLDGDRLILSYDNGDFVNTYKKESKDNVISELNPLVARWNFFSSSENGGPFVQVTDSDCYNNAFIIFGVEGNYIFDFPIDNNNFCETNNSFGTYTNDNSSITISGDKNSVAPYTIEGEFLTIDQSGDGTYFERFKKIIFL